MNPIEILAIARLSLSLAELVLEDNETVELGGELLKIIQKAVIAYESHTGEPIDPSLIRPITPLLPRNTF